MRGRCATSHVEPLAAEFRERTAPVVANYKTSANMGDQCLVHLRQHLVHEKPLSAFGNGPRAGGAVSFLRRTEYTF